MSIDFDHLPQLIDRLHILLAATVLLLLLGLLIVGVAFINARRSSARRSQEGPVAPVSAPAPVVLKEATTDAALQILSLLQKEARLVDFIQEDIQGHADAEIGAAVRVVHEGCRRVFKSHVGLVPIRSESEGSRLTLPKGFDAGTVRVIGNVVGEPPFEGILVHKGWVAESIDLPRISDGHDVKIIAPAEVEL